MKKPLFDFDRAMLLLLLISVFIVLKAMAIPTQSEADAALEKLASDDGIGIMDSNSIADNKVRMLDNMDYNELKQSLGIKDDFCLYFEDEEGNMVQVDHVSSGIGHSKIHVNGMPCG